MPRTIAIGDVHGCANEFEELLAAIDPRPEDRLIQLGDLVNRGPDSKRVLDLAREYGVEAILGNHEIRLLRYHREGDATILKEYDQPTLAMLDDADWAYLERLPKFKYDGLIDTVFIHGGFLPTQPWQTQPVEITTEIQVIDKQGRPAKRSDAPDGSPWADHWNGPPFVVYGHTPRPNVVERKSSMGIDTGCVYGGHLTAFVVDDRSLIQVRAHDIYAHSSRLPDPV